MPEGELGKETLWSQTWGRIADGTVKSSGGDHGIRKSASKREKPL